MLRFKDWFGSLRGACGVEIEPRVQTNPTLIPATIAKCMTYVSDGRFGSDIIVDQAEFQFDARDGACEMPVLHAPSIFEMVCTSPKVSITSR